MMRSSAAILVSVSLLWAYAGQSGAAPAPAAEPPAASGREKATPERIRVGDTAVVVADAADVTWQNKVIARIPRGGTFRVLQVRPDAVAGWIKILNREEIEWTKRGHEIGWVRRDQVALARPDQVDPAGPPVARAVSPDLPDAPRPRTPPPQPAPESAGPVKPTPSSPPLPREERQRPPTRHLPGALVPRAPADATAQTKDVVTEIPGINRSDAGHFSCRTFSGANRRLCAALSDGQSDEFRRLLAAGADINSRSEGSHTQGMTLLQVAVWNEWSIEKIQVLIQAGADVNAVDGRGRTALTLAAARQPAIDAELARRLIAAGADVNALDKQGMTALMLASMHDDPRVVKMLIDAGANVHARDETGWTALMHATRRTCGHAQVVQLLIRSGADVHAAHRYGGTALASASFNGHVRVVEILLKAGAQVNTTDTGGWTPLICACTNGHREIAALLVAAGADVRVADRLGRTPLSIASGTGMAETADLLTRAGAR